MSTIDLIPETAPFSTEQRAWLNGFFAGLINMQSVRGENRADLASVARSLVADEPTETTEESDDTFSWHDPAMPIDERLALAEGKPLSRRLMAAMAQLDCGTCGYVCQTYAEAIANGEETNIKLCEPGGRETVKALKKILAEQPAGPSTGTVPVAPTIGASDNTPSNTYSRRNPLQAAVLESSPLNAPESDKDTRHVVIDLGDSGLTYEPGDALGVYPSNCPELADAIIHALDADPNEQVTAPTGTVTTLRDALIHHTDLKNFDESLVSVFINQTNNGDLPALRELARNDDRMAEMDVLDLIQQFPAIRPPAANILAVLEPLKPRLYSIASSPKAFPTQVHLTVGKVTCTLNGRLRKGVASTMFAERLAPGDPVKVFVQKSHGFRLPDDDSLPIIMIGPGTGIAPFRAFLQERQARHAAGDNWLFFGDRRSQHDFLYRSELENYLETGLLTRLDTAFSRDQSEKIYVQDRMKEHGKELWDWLERGAHIYVCGDAKRMAKDVNAALVQIIAQHGGMNESDANTYVKKLAEAKRYQRDVY